MERFAKKIVEHYILDVWQVSAYDSAKYFYTIFVKPSIRDYLTGLLVRVFWLYIDLGPIILGELIKLVRGFMEHLLLVHRPNQFQ